MGGGDITTTKESRAEPPSVACGHRSRTTVGSGFNMASRSSNTPLYQAMGLNVDQMKAMDLASGTAQQTYEQGRPTLANGRACAFHEPVSQQRHRPGHGAAATAEPQTRKPIGARSAASAGVRRLAGSFQRGMADRNTSEQVATMVPTLIAQGFDNAQRAATAESGLMDADQRRQMSAAGHAARHRRSAAGAGPEGARRAVADAYSGLRR
jgi:hypothetical protein